MRRAAVALVLLLALLGGGVVLGSGALLDSEVIRARVIAAAERATGHAVRIGGRLQIAPGSLFALAPVVSVEDVALQNGPGFSRADMVLARRVEAVVALLPLLTGRLQVRSVMVEEADMLLERDSNGLGNWLPAAAPVSPPRTSGSEPQARAPVEVGPVRLEGGRVAWLGMPAVQIRSLTLTPLGGPIGGTVVVNGVELALGGNATGSAGPFELTAAGGGLALAVSGQQGGQISFKASAVDLGAVSALAGRTLPPLRDVKVTGQVGRAVKALAQLTYRALPVAVALDFAPSGGLAGPAALQVTADGGTLSAQGSLDVIAHSFDGALSADFPDLRRTGALAGVVLPMIQDGTVTTRVLPGPGGVGLLLRGMRLSSAQGDVAGDLALTFGPRPAIRGSLVGQEWNLDAWSFGPAGVVAAPSADPVLPAVSPAVAPGEPGWVIPDRALPFELLRQADSDLNISVGQAVFHGAAYRSVEARVLLQEGRLRVDPVRMVLPGGPVQGRFSVDASATPPTAGLMLHAQGVDAAGLGGVGVVGGTMDLDVDLRGAGASWHSIAGSLNGHAAASLVESEVENVVLARVFGAALRGANIPIDAGGRSHARCIAVRTEATDGQLRVATLALDTTRLRLEGDGSLDLGNETVDMHLRPVIRIGSTGVSVPVRLTGPFRTPRAAADKGVLAAGRFGISIAQLGAQLGGAGSVDPCGPALASIRDGGVVR